MYGGSGKLGRGGAAAGRGGAGRNRNIHSSFPRSPLKGSMSTAGRSCLAGAGAAPRNRAVSPLVPTVSAAPSTSDATIDETYSLVTSNPLNFAMMIRLAPNLVEEIKRVEAQGGVARIKFDGNANNPLGNIISVGGKEFKFTWSPETGDLCDIYEERQSGEDGTGLLVESGSAWRKLNVQRVLDESMKNHVKLRSEEAERKNKSRKAIVLDHRNPSTKRQFKASTASESNPCRNFKTNKEQPPPAKKRKVEPVSGPPKSAPKSCSVGAATTKGRTPTTPLVSPPKNFGAPTSPIGCVNTAKGGHANKEISSQNMNKTTNHDKDIGRPLVDYSDLQEKTGSRSSTINHSSDLRTVLISLLKESSVKGMSFKALEKAAVKAIPNSGRQIKSILKEIANFQAPGKYLLKSGVEIETLKTPLFKKHSSPEDTLQPSSENEKKISQQDHSELTVPTRIDSGNLDENVQWRSISLEEPGFLEKVAALNTDTLDAKMTTGNTEGPAVSSSDSDSENDSSSESPLKSRSISLSGSGSESSSSSDSESDASTNDHEMSDDDVDIMMTDDDGEKHQLQASASVLPKSLVVSGGGMDGQSGHFDTSKSEDEHNVVDNVKKDLHGRSVLTSLTANALNGSAGKAGPDILQRDIPRPHQRAAKSNRSDQSRVDQLDIVTQSNEGTEIGGRDRLGRVDKIVDTATEVHGIIAANVPEHASQGGNIHQKHKPNTLSDLNDKHKDASLTGSNDSNQRRRESSSDETSCPYSKYEKEEPQLKGSIRDFSEYAEYVKEYKEKYDIYISLDKILKSSREEFLKHHREIEDAVKKDPEKYSKLAHQIKESIGQAAERHKRLKRIFVVLYEESLNLKQKIKEFAAPHIKTA